MSLRTNRLWLLYRHNVESGRQFSLREWGIDVGPHHTMELASDEANAEQARRRVEKLLAAWVRIAVEDSDQKGEEMDDERRIFELGMALLTAVDSGDFERFEALLAAEVPVNFQHPEHLETAIHITCSRNAANAMTQRLLAEPEIDLLLRDKFGRQAWNNAIFYGIDEPLARQVLDRTRDQAEQEIGLEAFEREYREHMQRWMQEHWYQQLALRSAPGPA